MAKIDMAEKKLIRKVEAARSKWVENFRSSQTLDEFAKGVASYAGLDEGTVKSSLPAQNFQSAQQNAEQYVDALISNVRRAIETGKYKRNYRRAFGG